MVEDIGVRLPRGSPVTTTTYSHHILLISYNPILVKYGRTLAEYSRTLRVAADGILPHIAAYCLYIAVVGKT